MPNKAADSSRREQIAAEILQLSTAQIMAELRFFSEAAGQLTQIPREGGPLLCTDGETLYCNPEQTIRLFTQSRPAMNRALLHALLHCLLGHPFQRQPKVSRWWDLACDLAVEGVMCELDVPLLATEGKKELAAECIRIADYAGGAGAETIYNHFIDHPMPEEEYQYLARLFYLDSHELWYGRRALAPRDEAWAAAGPKERPEGAEENDLELPRPTGEAETLENPGQAARRKRWKRLARQVEADLETFHRKRGSRLGNLLANLKPIAFEQVDYSDFLRQFGTHSEVPRLSEDEFDLISYTYGLSVYGNIPLVEPLETRDEARIREFVIAIDTSGSVQGDLVQNFLQRTCNVLRQTGTFASQVKIFLLQCDSEVQSITEFTSTDQLDQILPQMDLRGFGGTDFRPVFQAVDKLLAEKKLQRIDGLLYFTDGAGVYPEEQPPYKTAFIFHRDDYISPNVPPWAVKAVLTTDNIKVMK